MLGKMVSHFRILEKLGEGAMGKVYLAEDTDLNRRVALKFIPDTPESHSESGVRLLQEARIAASLNHPGICTIHEIGEAEDGRRFIAMEAIKGETLDQMLERGPLDADKAIDLIRKIAKGLAHAHDADIIHRDIKPSNIMVTAAGEPKILDFGLARLTAGPRITRPGTIMGTMAYQSPEQVLGEDPDRQSDIWALGVVFYQMLTGTRPFTGEFDAALVYSIAHNDAPLLATHTSGLPAALQAVMDRMLARDKAERYDSLNTFLDDLARAEGGGHVASTRPAARPRLGLPGRWIALILVMVAVALGGFFLSGKSLSPTSTGVIAMAVLPLENLSGDSEQDYFADGFTSELIAGLTQVQGLQVMARGSVLEFRHSDLTVKQIAEKLGVDKVVTGTVQQENGALRASIEIIDIAKGLAMWANTFNGSDEEVLQLQGTMTRSILEVLKGKVTESEEQIFSGAPTIDPQAYRAYLKGRALIDAWGSWGVWEEALGLFREAAKIEPGFAPAYVSQAEIYNFMGWFSPETEYPAMCEAAASKALEIDPDLPEANSEMALYLFLFENRFDEAAILMAKAMAGAPGSVDVLGDYGTFLMLSGQCEEAVAIRRREAQADPLNFGPNRNLANVLVNCQEFEECIALCNQLKVRFPDEETHMDYFMAIAYMGLGQIDKALEAGKKSPGGYMAPIYWLSGAKDEAWQLVNDSEADPTNNLNRIALMVLEEDYDQAMDVLEEWAEARPVLAKFIINYPLFEPLHEQLRYQELMRKMNIPGY
jgi:TolB-like protein/tetratricopeptide (TPR) repeat protein/predicted Ser/Thr protein kinase